MDARGGRTGGRRLGGGWRPRCGRVRRARGVGGRATAAAPRTERMRKNVSHAATGTLSRRDAAPRGEARGGMQGAARTPSREGTGARGGYRRRTRKGTPSAPARHGLDVRHEQAARCLSAAARAATARRTRRRLERGPLPSLRNPLWTHTWVRRVPLAAHFRTAAREATGSGFRVFGGRAATTERTRRAWKRWRRSRPDHTHLTAAGFRAQFRGGCCRSARF